MMLMRAVHGNGVGCLSVCMIGRNHEECVGARTIPLDDLLDFLRLRANSTNVRRASSPIYR
jgi:hypothetical protein